MTLPALFQLRSLIPPDQPFTIVCPKKLETLWQCVPWVDNVLSFTGKRIAGQLNHELAELTPAACVILPNSFGSAWDLWHTGMPIRIGRSGRGRGAMLTHRLPKWQRRAGHDRHHEARKYLEIAACCGATDWSTDFPSLTVADDSAANSPVPTAAVPTLVLAPGAAYGPAKQWPSQAFNHVARWWTAEHGRVVVVGAPGEEHAAHATVDGCPDAINVVGRTDLRQLMGLLKQADCIVANDSGAMHLGAALSCRGVALFGSTDPVATGPLGGQWVVLQEPTPCAPCLSRTCKRADAPYECLTRITPETVIESINYLRTR